MEASTLPPLPGQPRSPGELVVQTGRLIGRRMPLLDPRTLIGQAPGCDVRLPDPGVEAVHCAVMHDPAGLVLIDLGSPSGTRVNGDRVAVHRLANNDVIDVAGCRFTVVLGTPPTAEIPSAGVVSAELANEALRVQAAAVAAQQAALFEDEIRLEQRGTALGRQEKQLASHLEQRQRELDEQEATVRNERAAIAAEAESARQVIETERQAAAHERTAAAKEYDKAVANRKRVAALRRRLRQRFTRHWATQESNLARREAELATGTDRLQRERAQVKAFQERLNGELEVGRRQLREDQQELALAQQRWEEGLNAERAQQQRARLELQLLAAEIEGSRQSLASQQREAEEKLARLGREAEGLEVRIRNQRARLEAAERDLAGLTPTPSSSSDPVIPSAAMPQLSLIPEQLDFALQEVMDQRLRLAEQWERFLQVQQTWEQDRTTVIAGLEADATKLAQREEDLRQAEQEVASVRALLARQQETVATLRGALEGSQTQLVTQRAEWQAHHEGMLADLDERERLLVLRGEHLEEVHGRRQDRRQEEDARQAEERSRMEEARRQYSSLWQECERQRETLTRQERDLANQALALERYRHELVQQAPDSSRAESQLMTLEKRELERNETESQRIEQQRRLLFAERQRLDDVANSLRHREDELAEGLRRYEQIEASRESDVAATRETQQQRERELRRLRAGRAIDERHLRQLREELERIAQMLIEEGEQVGRGPAAAA